MHPLMSLLVAVPGEKPDFAKFAKALKRRTGRVVTPVSVRLVAQGHRAPSGHFALDIETAVDSAVTARQLIEWPHYTRKSKRN